MATTEMIDYRRTDVRRFSHQTTYWLTSAAVSAVDSDDLSAVVFSFPAAVYGSSTKILIHDVGCQIVTAVAGGTCTVDVGACTLATDDVTTGGDTTDVDADEFIPNTDVTHGTPGLYFPDGGDFLTVKAAGTNAAPALITPADTTVPCITVYVASDGVITTGVVRILVRLSEIPIA